MGLAGWLRRLAVGGFGVLPAALFGATGVAEAACTFGMVQAPPLIFTSAGGHGAKVPANHVRINFLGHSSFAIESPKGVAAVTDYNGFNVPGSPPDAVTMNNSHDTHYTDFPDPRIRFPLRGWRPGGGMANNDITIRDMRIFSVPTNIGEYGDPRSNGNSVFVFEVSGLCIAHVGHLHHVLTRDQLQAIRRIDVLFMPVDGGMTMSHAAAMKNIRLIAPRLVIPMHFGFMGVAKAFFELAKVHYTIRAEKGSSLLVSTKTLPRGTEIRFLQGDMGGRGGRGSDDD